VPLKSNLNFSRGFLISWCQRYNRFYPNVCLVAFAKNVQPISRSQSNFRLRLQFRKLSDILRSFGKLYICYSWKLTYGLWQTHLWPDTAARKLHVRAFVWKSLFCFEFVCFYCVHYYRTRRDFCAIRLVQISKNVKAILDYVRSDSVSGIWVNYNGALAE